MKKSVKGIICCCLAVAITFLVLFAISFAIDKINAKPVEPIASQNGVYKLHILDSTDEYLKFVASKEGGEERIVDVCTGKKNQYIVVTQNILKNVYHTNEVYDIKMYGEIYSYTTTEMTQFLNFLEQLDLKRYCIDDVSIYYDTSYTVSYKAVANDG